MRQADQARTDFAANESELEVIQKQPKVKETFGALYKRALDEQPLAIALVNRPLARVGSILRLLIFGQ